MKSSSGARIPERRTFGSFLRYFRPCALLFEQKVVFAVILAEISARGCVSLESRDRRLMYFQMKLTSATHRCVSAALFNAFYQFSSEKAAQCMQRFLKKNPQLFRSLRPLSLILDKSKESVVHCRIVRHYKLQLSMQSPDKQKSFKEISARKDGIFV